MNMSFPKAAVLGWPVAHSLSPRLHGFWLKKYNISGQYNALAIELKDLRHALLSLAPQGFVGVNLTVPHKEAAMSFVTQCDETAKRIGAINTIVVRHDGTLEGRNTDAYGFTQNILAANFQHKNRPAIILGAGGAARAAIVALRDIGVSEIRILNRSQDKAQKLAGDFAGITVCDLQDADALKNAALLVNATSLGMNGQPPLVIDLQYLPADALVTDMVYAPLMTDVLKQAVLRGNPVVDGLGMLLHQARPAFQAFFGHDPEVTDELRAHVLAGAV